MIWFVVKPHGTRAGLTMVEIWRDVGEGEYVGAIYPEADGIRFVSAYRGRTPRTSFERPVTGRRFFPPLRVVNIEIGEERIL